MIKLLLLFLYFYSSISQAIGTIDDTLALMVGQKSQRKCTQNQDYKQFIFLNIKEYQGKNLVLIASPPLQNQWQKMQMFVYKYQQTNVIASSQNQNGQLLQLSIEKAKLQQNKSLMIVIKCQSECKFTFSSYWNNVQYLSGTSNVQFIFGQMGKVQYYQLDLSNQKFNELRITLMPQTKLMPTDKVKIYGKYGRFQNSPTQQQYDFKSVDLWRDGQGIFLEQNQLKQNIITLLVVGQSQTVYNLKVELLLKRHHDINLNETVYEHLGQHSVRIYHLKFIQNYTQQYLISFATFSGNIQIQIFLDQNRTKPFQSKPFTYQKDTSILINPQQFPNITQLFIKVSSDQRQAVFMIHCDKRDFSEGIQLDENVNQYISFKHKQIAYLHFEKWSQSKGESSQLTVNILKVTGNIKAQFRICKGLIANCINANKYKEFTSQINHYDSSMIGLNNIFKFKIDDEYTQFVNPVEKSGYIIIILTNIEQNSQQKCIAVLQYLHQSQVQLIREERPVQQIIRLGQSKFYKFVNTDQAIKQIKIHLNEIHGNCKIYAYRDDPRGKQNLQIAHSGNPVIITTNLNAPIFIKILGVSHAIYGLIVQVIHNNTSIQSSISLAQQVEFTIVLKPDSYQIFTVHPLYNSLELSYKASGSILSCIFINGTCEDQLQKIGSQGILSINHTLNSQQRIKIRNPSAQRAVQIKISYHSGNYSHCEVYKLGKVYQQIKPQNSCIGFNLDSYLKDVEVIIQRIDFGSFYPDIFICEQHVELTQMKRKFELPKTLLEKHCKDRKPTDWTIGFELHSKQNKNDTKNITQKMKIQFLVQQKGNIITLADGIGHQVDTVASQGPIKYFYYELLNIVETKIIMKKLKYFNGMFYVKIVESHDKNYDKYVSKNDFDYHTLTPQYLQTVWLIIKKQQIEGKCKKCAFIIAIFSQQKIGDKMQFTIEVIQRSQLLNDHKMVTDLALKSTVNYYEYEVKEANATLVIDVSDNNLYCTAVYLSTADFPSQNNNQAQGQGQRIVKEVKRGKYYIGVEGIQDCSYSISAFTTSFNLLHLQRGIPANLNMKKGQFRYFTFLHVSNISFKFVTLHKYGSVAIYVNESSNQTINKLKENSQLQFKSFKFVTNKKNSLEINPSDDGYCHQCYYFIVVQAEEDTQSSLILADQDTPIAITTQKKFHDEISKQNQTTTVTVSGVSVGTIATIVHHGKIIIHVTSQKYQITSPQFQSLKSLHQFKFSTKGNEPHYYWLPITIKVTCKTKHCLYEFQVKKQGVNINAQNSKNSMQTITPGSPMYVYVNRNTPACISGYLKNKDEKFMVTCTFRQSLFDKLQFYASLGDNKNITLLKKTASNVMELKFQLKNFIIESPKKFELCVKSEGERSISIFIEQTSLVNLLPEDTLVMVQQQNNFLIYPQGQFILDVFQCDGHASIMHGINENQLDNNSSAAHYLDTLGMPDQPHAVKIKSYSQRFIRVKAPFSLIRWIPINVQQGRGLGYLKYKIGNVNYNVQQKQLKIMFDSVRLRENQANNSNIQMISYHIYLSQNQQSLKSAAQCEAFMKNDTLVFNRPIDKQIQLNNKLEFFIKKKHITDKFINVNTIYLNVVADLIIKAPISKQHPSLQFYRFIYHEQQIPIDIFKKTEEEQFNLILLIVLIVFAVVGVIVISYVITKYIAPMISRIRNRMLIQQNNDNKEDVGQVIPPSSDRARITARKVGQQIQIQPDQKVTE